MKKISIISLIIVLILSISGCNKENDLWYGEVEGNKYINKKFSFEMDIPDEWKVKEDIENMNEEVNNLEDLEEVTICIMSSKFSNQGIKVDKHLVIGEGMSIRVINKDEKINDYIDKVYNIDFGDDSANIQNIETKDVNGKEFTIIEFKNNIVYLIKIENKIFDFNTVYLNDSQKEIIRAMNSIKFK
ncbi:hypothetical protein [Terrisporobacter vanillatitrophus]|uniref:hypothetical protein n=1 Tax=Terrisporobacter vanillatitrophus TaxID=3058402 RepID=UPI003368A600